MSVVTLAWFMVAAPGASAQDCTGTVGVSVEAESLPGGVWSVEGGCLSPDSFYQYQDGPVLAKAGYSMVTYTDGHSGRVAAGILTLGNGIGLAIVGVEDAATGLVKWSAVLGDFNSESGTVSVSGQGVALLPVERANVSASLSGTGTDVAGLMDKTDPPDSPEPGTEVTPPEDVQMVSPTPPLPGAGAVTGSGSSSSEGTEPGATDPVQDSASIAPSPGDEPAAAPEHQAQDSPTGAQTP